MARKAAPINIIPEVPPPRGAVGQTCDPHHYGRQAWCAKWKAQRYTRRDLAHALGVSPERVSQLLRKAEKHVQNAEAAE